MNFISDLPTLFVSDRYRKQKKYFLGLIVHSNILQMYVRMDKVWEVAVLFLRLVVIASTGTVLWWKVYSLGE